MTGFELIDWIIGSIVALAGVAGVLAGGMKMYAEGRVLRSAPKTPYDVLSNRLEKLEKSDEEKSRELSRIRSQVYRLAGVLTREVATLIRWHENDQPPPPPDREVGIIKEVITEITEDEKSSNNS